MLHRFMDGKANGALRVQLAEGENVITKAETHSITLYNMPCQPLTNC